MKHCVFHSVSILLIALGWLQPSARGQSNSASVAPLDECIVRKVKFTVTEAVMARSAMEYCGTISGKCCQINMIFSLGDSVILVNSSRGTLSEPDVEQSGISCRPSVNNYGVADITWSVLQEIYGYDSIKNNKIPPDCLKAAKSPSVKTPNQSAKDITHEQRLILDALDDAHGNVSIAAEKLGISERALLRKMKEYKIDATTQ